MPNFESNLNLRTIKILRSNDSNLINTYLLFVPNHFVVHIRHTHFLYLTDGSLIEPELVETSSPPRKAFRGHYDEYRDREQMFDLRTPLVERLCASQPAEVFRKLTRAPSINTQHSGSEQNFNGFTQPAQLSDLVLSGSGSTQATQGTQTQFQRLVKRMTRFWVKNSQEDTDKFLQALLEKMQYNFRCKPKGVVSNISFMNSNFSKNLSGFRILF